MRSGQGHWGRSSLGCPMDYFLWRDREQTWSAIIIFNIFSRLFYPEQLTVMHAYILSMGGPGHWTHYPGVTSTMLYQMICKYSPECWLADSRGISGHIPWVWQNISFYCSNDVGNQFIIAISHLSGLWYMANIPRLRAVSRHSATRTALSRGILAIYHTSSGLIA